MHRPLIDAVQHRVAVIAIGPSTARRQGTAGVVASAQRFLATLSLAPFASSDSDGFRTALDEATERLRDSFPEVAKSWGLARKCLNIFLRDAFYNHYLREHYGLAAGRSGTRSRWIASWQGSCGGGLPGVCPAGRGSSICLGT